MVNLLLSGLAEWIQEGIGTVIKMVGEFGIIGQAVDLLYLAAKGDLELKDFLDFGKELIKGIAELGSYFGKIAKGTAKWASSIFNVDEIAKKIGEAAKKTGDIFDSVAKWAGNAIGVVSEFVENFEENGGWTWRTVAETIGEFALGLAIDKLLEVGTIAVLGAIGITSVAVPVVGAIVIGAKFVGDLICEQITGKNLTEFISDLVIDTVEGLVVNTATTLKSTFGAKEVTSGEETIQEEVTGMPSNSMQTPQDNVVVWGDAMEVALAS